MRYTIALPPIFLAATTASPAWAQYGGAYDSLHMGDGHHMWGGGWFGMIVGPIMMIVLIVAAILIVVLAVRWMTAPGRDAGRRPPPGAKSALEILEGRYARGEIDREEFEERRRVLKGKS